MFNPRIITVEVEGPAGYYDDEDDFSEEGLVVLADVLEDAGFVVNSIEQ